MADPKIYYKLMGVGLRVCHYYSDLRIIYALTRYYHRRQIFGIPVSLYIHPLPLLYLSLLLLSISFSRRPCLAALKPPLHDFVFCSPSHYLSSYAPALKGVHHSSATKEPVFMYSTCNKISKWLKWREEDCL